MTTLRDNSGVRYFLASLCALALDYILTLTLYHFAGVSLSLAAGIAFVCVGIAFYFVHEYWTFRREASGFSGRRLVANLTVLVVAGIVRVAVIFLLEVWKTPVGLWVTLYFVAGVACSFATNFVLNRFFVFRN